VGATAFIATEAWADNNNNASGNGNGNADWLSAGADLSNSRYQDNESRIKSNTVGSLQLKWTFSTEGDVQAHPAVDGKYLYFPDSKGFLYKVEKKTGALVWKRPISDYTGFVGDSARGTPAVAGKLLILGNLIGRNVPLFGQPVPPPAPARVFAVDKDTGDPVWSTKVDDTGLAFVTSSPIVYKDTAFVGVASNEELIAAFVPKANWQWQFRGSALALNVKTGAIKWQTFMMPSNAAAPPNDGYYGAGIWSSTGAIDKENNQIFMTSGNNTMAPASVRACLTGGGSHDSCVPSNIHFDSVVALDIDTGHINWAKRGLTHDVYNVGCGIVVPGALVVGPFGPPFDGTYDNCPFPPSAVTPPGSLLPNPPEVDPDWDFAQGAMLLDDDLVGAGQKSGVFWAFKRKTGQLVWSRQIVPGGITGGMQWGSATDGRRIFVASSNSGTRLAGAGTGAMPWTLKNGTVTTAGGWAAMDQKTGAVLWTTADPMGSRAEGAVAATNDVVFGCNLAAPPPPPAPPSTAGGRMFALHAETGAILWSYDSGAPCNAGASISDGMVFWGSGTFSGFGPKKVFAFGFADHH
jgi:polyvinyl alcohol dehydrogenase (cytochrome)